MTAHAASLVATASVALAETAPPRGELCVHHASRRLRITPHFGGNSRVVDVRYLWAGAAGAPTVIVQGGISAGCGVCAIEGGSAAGWWDELVGLGKAIDLRRVRVLAIDWLSADDLCTAAVSSRDQAAALAALLDALHIGHVAAFIGASYGAMVGLAFAVSEHRRLGRLVLLAGAHRAHPLAAAQRSIQRSILRLGLAHGCTREATSLARQLAMTTYRGSGEFAERFAGVPAFHNGRWHLPVEAWLEHVGDVFAGHFDARRYLSLSESIDLHSVDPATVHVPTTLIGFASDRLVPLADLCELQRTLGAPASLEVLESPYGHDGFLKEPARIAPLLREALAGA